MMVVFDICERIHRIGPYSQATKYGDTIYVSGCIALDPVSGVLVGETAVQQAEQVFKNMKAILLAAGGDMNTVLKTTVLLKNIDDFPGVNAVYATAFGTHRPARATYAVAGLPKNAQIEIECIAHIKK